MVKNGVVLDVCRSLVCLHSQDVVHGEYAPSTGLMQLLCTCAQLADCQMHSCIHPWCRHSTAAAAAAACMHACIMNTWCMQS